MKHQENNDLCEQVVSNLMQLDELDQQYVSSLVRGMKLAQESVKQQPKEPA